MDNRSIMPPLFRTGTIPHFLGGGPVFAVPQKGYETKAGKALAACSNARQGRLVLDSDPDTRWIARRGDLDDDHTPSVAFEGRARKGEAFHLYAWEDGTFAIAAWHGRALTALPFVVQTHKHVDLGPLGSDWIVEWEDGQASIRERRYRSHSRKERSVPHSGATVFLPEADRQGPQPRAAVVFRAAFLQAMNDLAERIGQQPPVIWPVTGTPRPGWIIPTFAATGAPKGANLGLDQMVYKNLFPAMARAMVAQHLVSNGPPVKISVHHTMPIGLGTIPQPRLHVDPSSEQAFVRLSLYKTFVQDALGLFTYAWEQGNLGNVWAWCSTKEQAVEVVFDHTSFSRHAVLAAMAPEHVFKAKQSVPPPADEAPWWAYMLDEDLERPTG